MNWNGIIEETTVSPPPHDDEFISSLFDLSDRSAYQESDDRSFSLLYLEVGGGSLVSQSEKVLSGLLRGFCALVQDVSFDLNARYGNHRRVTVAELSGVRYHLESREECLHSAVELGLERVFLKDYSTPNIRYGIRRTAFEMSSSTRYTSPNPPDPRSLTTVYLKR